MQAWNLGPNLCSQLLGRMCGVLLSYGTHLGLRQLSLTLHGGLGDGHGDNYLLPDEVFSTLQSVTALRHLALVITDLDHVSLLAAALHSLQKLQVGQVQWFRIRTCACPAHMHGGKPGLPCAGWCRQTCPSAYPLAGCRRAVHMGSLW